MKTMFPVGYHRNGFVATHAHDLLVFMIAFILHPSCLFKIWALGFLLGFRIKFLIIL